MVQIPHARGACSVRCVEEGPAPRPFSNGLGATFLLDNITLYDIIGGRNDLKRMEVGCHES